MTDTLTVVGSIIRLKINIISHIIRPFRDNTTKRRRSRSYVPGLSRNRFRVKNCCCKHPRSSYSTQKIQFPAKIALLHRLLSCPAFSAGLSMSGTCGCRPCMSGNPDGRFGYRAEDSIRDPNCFRPFRQMPGMLTGRGSSLTRRARSFLGQSNHPTAPNEDSPSCQKRHASK